MTFYKMKIILPILTVLFCCSSYAFDTNLLIMDSETKEPIESVKISVLDNSKKDTIMTKYTDLKGSVRLSFKSDYRIFAEKQGYNSILVKLKEKKENTYLLDPINFNTEEVVVTGQYSSTPLRQSMYPVRIISTEKIQARAASNLKELLATESSVRISQDQILGSSISINGISGENVKIMVDGVPVIGRMNGYIDLGQINLSNIKKVEIIDNPMSGIYGTDALGGVINLISNDQTEKNFSGSANAYYESVGVYNTDLSATYNFDKLHFSLSGGRNLFQGYDPIDNDKRNQEWKPKEQYFIDLSLSWLLKNHTFRLKTSYFNEFVWNRGALRAPYYESAIDDKYKTDRLSSAIFASGKLSNNIDYESNLSYSYYRRKKNTYSKNMVSLIETLSPIASDHDTTTFNAYTFRFTLTDDKLSENLKLMTGTDVNYENAEGKKIEGNKKDLTDVGVFLSLRYNPLETVAIQPALRYINNSEYKAPLITSLNIKWTVADNLSFKGYYSKGFRSPSLKELYLIFVDINHNIYGNTNLKAETSDNFGLSFQYSINNSNSANCYVLTFEPSLFYNKIYDKIDLADIGNDIYKNVNISNYRTEGVNLTMSYIRETASYKASVAYTGRSSSLSNSIEKFSYSPEFSLELDYCLPIWNIKANLFYKYTGQMPNYSLNSDSQSGKDKIVKTETNDYSIMDFGLSKEFFNFVNINVGCKNLFDVNDIKAGQSENTTGHSSGNGTLPISWGRTLFIKFSFQVK